MIYAQYDSQITQNGQQIRPGRGRKYASLGYRRPQIGPDRPKWAKNGQESRFWGVTGGCQINSWALNFGGLGSTNTARKRYKIGTSTHDAWCCRVHVLSSRQRDRDPPTAPEKFETVWDCSVTCVCVRRRGGSRSLLTNGSGPPLASDPTTTRPDDDPTTTISVAADRE